MKFFHAFDHSEVTHDDDDVDVDDVDDVVVCDDVYVHQSN